MPHVQTTPSTVTNITTTTAAPARTINQPSNKPTNPTHQRTNGFFSLVAIAADISPIDVISHLPVLCEDSALGYVFVPSKSELGAAANTKRPTSVVLAVTAKRPKAAAGGAGAAGGGKKEDLEYEGRDKVMEAIAEVVELHKAAGATAAEPL